jgi:hypothetical protein
VLTFLTRGKLRLAILCAGSLFCAADAHGQDVTESSLKAAFIHNFAKFTQWPREVLPPAAPLLACVLGDAAFGDVLGSYVKGHPIDGHEIVVSRVTSQETARSCHILYVSGVTATRSSVVVAVLSGAPVLSLSFLDQF